MKKDSADGRFLMWKVTTHAFLKNPVKGAGIGGFPAAFAEAQANYLDSDRATGREKWIAGCPETAFNEYLHILTELGIFGLVFFAVACGFVIYIGIKRKRYYVVGGIISLLIFAFSSYPFHEPSFLPVLVVLGVIAVNNLRVREVVTCKCSVISIVAGILLAGAAIYISWQERERLNAYTEWPHAKVLYKNKAHQAAAENISFCRNHWPVSRTICLSMLNVWVRPERI